MSQKQKQFGDNEGDDSTPMFKIPDTSSVLNKLKDTQMSALRREHQEIQEEEDKEDKKKGKPKKKKKNVTAICFCGDPGCRIGPFTERGDGGSSDAEG